MRTNMINYVLGIQKHIPLEWVSGPFPTELTNETDGIKSELEGKNLELLLIEKEDVVGLMLY